MKTVQAMLAEAEAAVPRISTDEAKGLLGRPDVLFLDVREPPEVAASGKVRGAIAVPRGLVEFRADPASPMHDAAFDRAKTVVDLLRLRRALGAGRQDPQGHGLRERAQSRRLQGLARRRRRNREGLSSSLTPPSSPALLDLGHALVDLLGPLAAEVDHQAVTPSSAYSCIASGAIVIGGVMMISKSGAALAAGLGEGGVELGRASPWCAAGSRLKPYQPAPNRTARRKAASA